MDSIPVFKTPIQTHHPGQTLRIKDVLLQDNDEDFCDDDGGFSEECSLMGQGSRAESTGIGCSSPRRIVGRLLSALRRGKVKGGKEGRRECGNDRMEQMVCSTDGFDGRGLVHSGAEASLSGQGCSGERNVNLGVGGCLLYLVATSKDEVDKMAQMRAQLDTLVQDVKEVLRKQDVAIADRKPREKSDMSACSTTDELEAPDFGHEISQQTVESDDYALPEDSLTVTVCDQSLKCETPKEEESLEGMEKLVAELEVELEHLALQLDMENLPEYPQQQGLPMKNEDTASTKSKSISSGEVVDPGTDSQATYSQMQCAVSPYELERRLHELLESRQQEKIKELEGALECVKRKLRDKEMEVAWWKDTAKLMAQHAKEPSQLTSRHAPNLLSP